MDYPSAISPEELEAEGLRTRSAPAFWIVPNTTTSINLGPGLSFPYTTNPTMRMPEATIFPIVDSRRPAQAPKWPSSSLIYSPPSVFQSFSIRTSPYPEPTWPQYQETIPATSVHHLSYYTSGQPSSGLNSHPPRPSVAQNHGVPCGRGNPGPQSDSRQPITRGLRTDPLAAPRRGPAEKDMRGGIFRRLFCIFKRP